jgi:3-deoxy-D-manno-octulosonic-acid transferase
MALERIGGAARVFAAPFDLGGGVRRFLRRMRPRLLVLECLEMWPRLVSSCQAAGVPVAVVNGRLSGRSLTRYRWLPSLFGPCFSSLDLVTALSSSHRDRFAAAGTPPHRIAVESSSKHGALLPLVALTPPAPRRRVVLGSLHSEEENLLIPQVRRLWREVPGLEVVIAPRYPHRARALRRALSRVGLPSHVSSLAEGSAPESIEVVDRMGELAQKYRGAAAAFVGGSLAPRGGHNVLEPAAWGVPVLFGPYTAHCEAEADALVRAGGGAVVLDGDTFCHQAHEMLFDGEHRREAGSAARDVARCFSGAAARIASRLMLLAGSEEQP